jgi:CRP-like cAMP-binding protein
MKGPHYSPIKNSGAASGNRLLAALPRAEYERLYPHLRLVHLAPGKIIYNTGEFVRYAYFPKSGMLSLLSTTDKGRTIEVGMIGNEGIVGLPIIFRSSVAAFQVTVQLATNAYEVRGSELAEEFKRGEQLQDTLLRYTNTLLIQISQSAACNRFHTAEERLCRWLLLCRDRTRTDTIPLTQEFLSYMLGVPRSSVTAVARALQEEGLIRYSRGRIVLLDRPRLETASCECYSHIREEFRHLLVA